MTQMNLYTVSCSGTIVSLPSSLSQWALSCQQGPPTIEYRVVRLSADDGLRAARDKGCHWGTVVESRELLPEPGAKASTKLIRIDIDKVGEWMGRWVGLAGRQETLGKLGKLLRLYQWCSGSKGRYLGTIAACQHQSEFSNALISLLQ